MLARTKNPAWPSLCPRISAGYPSSICQCGQAMQRASFPVFTGSDHAVQWTPYSLAAGALHLGSTPQQGHYRTFMANSRTAPCATMQELTAFSTEPSHNSAGGRGYSAPTGRPSAPAGSPSYTWWCTEDGKPAEVCHPTYSRILSENCFFVLILNQALC